MLDKISIAWRVGFALVWLSLCLLWSVSVTSDYWLLALGLIGAGGAICLGHFGRAIMFVIEAVRALFQSPETPEYEHTVEGVREASLRIHNWVSRNVAAAIGCGVILALIFTHGNLIIGLIGLVAIPAATHWPAIRNRIRDWSAMKPEAAE